MGRAIGIPDSVYSGAGVGFLAQGRLTAYATGNIGAGELCTLHESGAVTRTDPSLPWDLINNNNPGPTVVISAQPATDIVLTGFTVGTACGYPVRLPISLRYVVPLQGPNGIGFQLRASAGAPLGSIVIVTTDVSTDKPYILALPNDNFVVFWHVSGTLKHRVYGPTGVPVTAAITVSTIVSIAGLVPWHGHCALANGNFVVTWSTTGGAFQAQIYSNVGVAVGSLITIDSVTGQWHCAMPCANGDFICSIFDTAHSLHKLYRITNAGTVTWGPFTPSGCAGALFTVIDAARMHPQHMRLIELNATTLTGATPNIAWVLPNTSGYANVFVISASGALVAQCDPGPTWHDVGVPFPLALSPNGFAFSYCIGTSVNTYASFFSGDGICIQQNVLVDSSGYAFPANTSVIIHTYMGWCGGAFAISRYANGAGQVEAMLIYCDQTGQPIAMPPLPLAQLQQLQAQAGKEAAEATKQIAKAVQQTQQQIQNAIQHAATQPNNPNAQANAAQQIATAVQHLQTTVANDLSHLVPICDIDGSCFVGWFSSGIVQLSVTHIVIGRSSVIGIAQGAATEGEAVQIVSEGYFELPESQVFGPGQAFDQRNAPVVGCRGTVGGAIAVLFGWL